MYVVGKNKTDAYLLPSQAGEGAILLTLLDLGQTPIFW